MFKLVRHLPTVARLCLGLVFFVFGLNGLLHFAPLPPMAPEGARVLGVLVGTGYFFVLEKAVEVAAGALLLAGIALPFALTLLAPIVVNIAAFHLFLDPGGMPVALLLLTLEIYLALVNRAAFAPLFARRPAGHTAPVARLSSQAA